MNKGVLYGLGGYIAWGILPIYWRSLAHTPAREILGHRVFWSFIFLLGLLVFQKNWSWLQEIKKNRRLLLIYLAAAVLLAGNWLIFIWAINSEQIVKVSLGYFINPLVNVGLGVLFLGETLRRWQKTAVFCAFLGVLYLTFVHGELPWIALTLAFSFSIYGFVRKTGPLAALPGLSLEIGLIAPLALGFILFWEVTGSGHLIRFRSDHHIFVYGLWSHNGRAPLALRGRGQANQLQHHGHFAIYHTHPTIPYRSVLVWRTL